jgi:hypothetical protein
MTVIEGSARLGGSGMRLVRFRGGALLVHLDDALHWLLRCATPELMLVNAPESVHGREIRRGAEALLEAEGITVTRHRAREVERVAARVSEARSALLGTRTMRPDGWKAVAVRRGFCSSTVRLPACWRRDSRRWWMFPHRFGMCQARAWW